MADTETHLWAGKQEQHTGAHPEAQLAYWRQQLAGLPVLQLPADHPRPAVLSDRSGVRRLSLPPELAEALQRLGRQQGTTLFTILLAAFQALLHRYTAQEGFGVGTMAPALDKGQPTLLVMQADLSGNPSFRQLVGRVKEVVQGAHANRDVPFARLVELLQPVPTQSHHPLVQVLLALQADEVKATGFDLSLRITECEEGLVGEITFSTDLFEAVTIDRMAGHWQTLLAAIVADPDERVGNLPLMTAVEQEVLAAWNQTAAPYPQGLCVHELVEAQVERTPEAVAVEAGDESLTYRALNQRANQLAHYLRRLGVGPEVLVGVCMERSLEMVVSLLAVMKAGGAYVPIDPAYPPDRIAFMLEDAQVPVLLTQERLAGQLPPLGARILTVDSGDTAWADESEANPASGVTAQNLAYVIYTSGSTGKPKGVMNEHRGICNRLQWMQERFPLTPADVVLQKTPYSFDVSVPEFFGTLLAGAKLVMARPGGHQDPDYLAKVIETRGVTQCHFVPSMLQVFLEQPGLEKACRSLRRVLASGEALSYDLQERFFRRIDAALLNLYGPTETAVEVSYWPCRPGDARRAVPIGYPVANVQLHVLDAAMQPVPVGVPGELYIGGVAVARGYWNRPELTAERFVPNPLGAGRLYRTGDQVRWLPDGAIEYLGRIDYQVKVRGFRIELGEIEAVLAQHEGVREAVVLAREDQPGDKRLVAYVVPAGEAKPEARELRRFLRTQLPEHMVPTTYVVLSALPLTPSGKTDRRALPAPELGREGLETPYTAPSSATEETLAEIWANVLGLGQVGVHDNFFDLGGHSLLATRILARVRAALGVDLAVPILFEAPTIAELSKRVDAAGTERQGRLRSEPIMRIARGEPLPCSFAQLGIWLVDQLEPGSAAYNIPTAMRLTGELDRGALERALREIVRRHEPLRTTYRNVGGQPMQVIDPEVKLALRVVDLRDLPETEREERARQLAAEEAGCPFDLAAGPVVRTTLLQLAETEHILLLTIHHIASDGWSAGVFERELSVLYEAFAAGRPSPLPDLGLQYADLASWQRKWLQSGVMEEQLAYWFEQLSDPPVLQLPTDYPRPARQSHRGATRPIKLGPELTQRLKALSRQEGATLFMTLLAAFQILLHRYTGQTDISVGSPVAGRTQIEAEQLIGLFVNSLVMRTDLAGNPSFRELLGRVRKVVLGAFSHQDVPFEQLVEVLQPQRSLSHHPFFQVMLAMQTAPGGDLAMPGLSVSATPVDSGAAKFDLEISLAESEAGLVGEIIYCTDLFQPATIDRMIGHLQTLLEAAAADPDLQVGNLPLMTPTEQWTLAEWNWTATEFSRDVCIHQLVEAQVKRTPDAVAVEFENERLTYSELNRRANRLAHYLRRQGVGAEVLVGVCLERSLEMVIALLAVMKAGGAYVPIDPVYPPDRIAYMLADAQVRVLLTQRRLVGQLPPVGTRMLAVDSDTGLWAAESTANPFSGVAATDLAYVIYTSGSTGKPKGVMNEHRGVCNRLLWMQERFPLTPADVVLQKTPYSFDVSVPELFGTLLAGARLVMARPGGHQDPGYLAKVIEARGITQCHFVPSMLQVFLEQPGLEKSCRSLRRVLASGEALPYDLQERFFRRLDAELINLYGPTEAAVEVSYWPCQRGGARRIVPIGRPIANVQLHVLDEAMQPVPVGVPGELYIGGVAVARGYWNKPQLTQERFVPNPLGPGRLYRTGDQVRWLPDGAIEYLGRIDHQVKVRGFRIELGEIEAVLTQHAGVREAVVLAREDQPGEKRLVAYVVPDAPGSLEEEELRQFLKAQLPAYMVPAAFVQMSALPLIASGKVDRSALPAPELGREGLDNPFVAPRTPTEAMLAEIWKELLRVEQVGVHDHFFALGGHSLLAAQVITHINVATGLELTARTLFDAPTVATLAEQVESAMLSAMSEEELAETLAELEADANG